MHRARPASNRFAASFRSGASRLLFASFLCLALAVGFAALAPRVAQAAEIAGPFLVEGPAGAYAWDGTTLSITADGVVIQGMADLAAAGDVRVAAAVSSVGIGDGVRIDELAVDGTTRFSVSGSGNEVSSWRSVRGDAIGGTGSLTIGSASSALDIHDSATVTVNGAVQDVSVWERASLALGPEARIALGLTAFGGTLDFARVPLGAPIPLRGVSIGDPSVDATLIAPFGATRLDELLSYTALNVRGSVSVVEAGEQVGTLLPDGTFGITATRTVTFVGFEGQPVAVEQVRLFQAATAPEVSAPDGYEFVGWDRSFARVTEDMAVVARFAKLPEPEPTQDPAPVSPSSSDAGRDGSSSGYGGANAVANQHLPMNSAKKAAKTLARTGDAACAPFALAAAASAAALIAAGAGLVLVRGRGDRD